MLYKPNWRGRIFPSFEIEVAQSGQLIDDNQCEKRPLLNNFSNLIGKTAKFKHLKYSVNHQV